MDCFTAFAMTKEGCVRNDDCLSLRGFSRSNPTTKQFVKKLLVGFFAIGISTLSLHAEYLRDSTKEVVLDTSSGLMWQDNANAKTTTATWATALTTCEDLSLGGYSDWRLPNYNELYQLADRSRSNPAISSVFQNTASSFYWSSSTYAPNTGSAWDVYFLDGNNYANSKTYSYYVRCVRAGQ